MKALLLDIDGVILKKGEYFSVRFAREHNLPVESVVEFFKGPFILCQKGEADLKEVVGPYLEKWGWKDGVDAFLTYWFESDFELNEVAIQHIREMRRDGVVCYIASNNERYRAEYINARLKGLGLIEGSFFSYDLRVRKDNPEFFKSVLRKLGQEPTEVAFVDNDEKNVVAARESGIDARLYHEGILTELGRAGIKQEMKIKVN